MNAMWWFALPILLLPIWWHRRKREQHKAELLATSRFLPRAEPRQTRAWRWNDVILLLVRCLMLATAIAWLADPVMPWRGDTVIVAAGTDAKWADQQATQAGLTKADRLTMPAAQTIGWLRAHEREWRPEARLLVLGDVPMPAFVPEFGRRIELRTLARAPEKAERRVHIASERPEQWRRVFAADGIAIDEAPTAKTALIVWDRKDAPPPSLRAPLWLVTDPAAFPELAKAPQVDGLRYADSARGRLWRADVWPPKTADAARTLLDNWQRLHLGPPVYTAPSRTFAASGAAHAPEPSGALRGILMALLVALFVLERILTHARRR
ncbi:BatA domain-containing protein [Massilia sp. 9I]|uniref:BatA domain-containing protein n=1 Tax=Massilia sp. 9I TaxID=2653152 RepID=UPI0012F08A74|nr:BatA domain-containing protein [Massilia sp. 9I]VXC11595.1 N-terminal double-transmembrane domain-containing protein [Massilia sp. 9I]